MTRNWRIGWTISPF